MAVATGLQHGKWIRDQSTQHWLPYKKFAVYDDATAEDIIAMQAETRRAIAEAQEILALHNIKIRNIYSADAHNPMLYDRVYKLAIGFDSREDLVMAKMILKCDELN